MTESEPLDEEPRNTAAALTVIAPPSATMVVPAMVADLGEHAALRFIDFLKAGAFKTCLDEVGSFEMCPFEAGSFKMRLGEASSFEMRLDDAGPGEARSRLSIVSIAIGEATAQRAASLDFLSASERWTKWDLGWFLRLSFQF